MPILFARFFDGQSIEPGFGGSYPSVSRYVAKLKESEPERVWRIECEPGEELQVDFGLGAPLVF